jgi:DNA-directed RNA polymerase I, II, and III subunit RPABC2
MSDDEKSYSSSANNSDVESDDDNVQDFKPAKKVILPLELKTNMKIDTDDDDDDDEDDSVVDTENSDNEDDDLSEVGDYNEENAADEVFNADPTAKAKTSKKARNGPRRNEEPEISYEMDSGDEDENEDDDADGEQYLQKFDEFTKQSAIDQYHPELLQHNHDEIEVLCVVVRDNNGNIIDPLHRTMPFLTKYERARILGERAKQIDAGAIPLIPVEDGMIDSYLIAVEELTQKKVPFIVKRPLPNGGCEYWKLKDLEFL